MFLLGGWRQDRVRRVCCSSSRESAFQKRGGRREEGGGRELLRRQSFRLARARPSRPWPHRDTQTVASGRNSRIQRAEEKHLWPCAFLAQACVSCCRVQMTPRQSSPVVTPAATARHFNFGSSLARRRGDTLLIRGCGRTDFQQVGVRISVMAGITYLKET